jgi:NAD(P)H-flavin reductase/hemoglobin-like flavoprotein
VPEPEQAPEPEPEQTPEPDPVPGPAPVAQEEPPVTQADPEPAAAPEPEEEGGGVDVDRLKRTWAQVARAGGEVPHFFYSHLFLSHPETRAMFPISMASQRDKLVGALGHVVSRVDQLEEVTPFLQQLGRDHRRFGALSAHYPAVGASLLATLQHFLGPAWTKEVAADWAAAYGVIATAMVTAAEESEATSPAAWQMEVTEVERRTLDVVVLQLRPQQPYPYSPGQSLSLQVPSKPRLWRYYSPANAPRPDGTLELHVQLVPGGPVSTSIQRSLHVGDVVDVGAPIGDQLVLPEGDRPDLLLVAGGTGLAPLRAVDEQLAAEREATGSGPQVHLVHGARMPWNLYEHGLLTALSREPWFTYTEVVSEDPSFPGAKGLVGQVAADSGDWRGRTAMVCGSPAMVNATVAALTDAGMPAHDVRYEKFSTVLSGPTGDDPREASPVP